MPSLKPKPKKSIRTGQIKVPPTSKPKCPTHSVEMKFTSRMLWECTIKDCGMVAFPRQDLDSGKPIIGTGELELVVIRDEYGDHQVFLKATATNIMLEITKYMSDPNDKYSSTQDGEPERYDVALILDKGMMIDHHGRPITE